MTREILERLLLFLVPFLLYGVYLALASLRPAPLSHGTPWTLLFIAGLSLFALSFVIWGFSDGEPITGTYVAPHMENGRIVPGYVKLPETKP